MTTLTRGMVIQVNLDPTVGSETGKTRPVDHTHRMVAVLGELTAQELRKIDEALKTVFAVK